MNILVSNDDGIFAPGLAVLGEACRRVGQVTVVAPDREQSGTSHSLTLHHPLRPRRRHDGSFQVDGTPTDCVLLAVGALMPVRPDFVFSGINHGPNMGEDVLYSGTVSVAMEGVALGIPGIAFSISSRSEVKGIKVTTLGSRFFSESITRMNDPWGREVFWIGGGEITWTGDADSDHQAVHDGYISITPLHMDLTNYPLLETVRGWSLEG
jgi:5'-nucleotidase